MHHRSVVDFRVDVDIAAMIFDDAVNCGHAHAAAQEFGGEERFEYPGTGLFGHADAIVGHAQSRIFTRG